MTRTSPHRLRDYWLGARLAIGDGRRSMIRLSLTAIGIALVTLVLLSGSAASNALSVQAKREDARELVTTTGAADLRVVPFDRDIEEHKVEGLRLEQTGPTPPLPPGLRSIPKPGEIVLSPALAKLLASKDGELLRPRFPERAVGKIDSDALTGPHELYFYVGEKLDSGTALAVSGFGPEHGASNPDVILVLLLALAAAAGLTPLVLFVITSSRVGGVSRDRRLAAIRLVGADAAQLRRIAAGESLVGAAVGLVAGIGLFFATRPTIELFNVQGFSVYASDWTPSMLAVLLIVAAVPLVAVGSALFALRRTVVEPLGVVRRARGRQRKLVWRLALLIGGGALVTLGTQLKGNEVAYVTGTGAIMVLLAVPTLLPWLLERVAGAVRGKRPSVLLAARRLQLDSATSARVTAGVSVLLAAAVALQIMLATATKELATPPPSGVADVTVDAPVSAATAEQLQTALHGVPGVRIQKMTTGIGAATTNGESAYVVVASCETLRTMAQLPSCGNGDVFLSTGPWEPLRVSPGTELGVNPDPVHPGKPPAPGGPRWVIPSSAVPVQARSDETNGGISGVLATPGVVPAGIVAHGNVAADLRADNVQPATVKAMSNALAGFGRDVSFHTSDSMSEDESVELVRRILFILTCVIMFIAMASLLVSTIDSLVERRQPIAVMSAAGVPRRTLAGSLIFQSMVPLLLSAVIALSVGAGLAMLTLLSADVPAANIAVDWAEVGMLAGVVVLVAALVALSTLPTLHRAMRPEGLRVE